MKGKLTKLINQYESLYQERKAEILDDVQYNRMPHRELLNDAERFYAIREMLKDWRKEL